METLETWGELQRRHRMERAVWAKTVIDLHRGNISAAARGAGVQRTYLYRLIREAGFPLGPRRAT